MKLLTQLSGFPDELRRGAVAIGNFDGVHKGHARIIERLLMRAREVGGPAVVFTFDPHPVRLLRPEVAPPPLTWTDRKAQLLNELGVDGMVAYPTDQRLLSLAPEQFFQHIVREQLDARAMVEGPNFFFGHNRAGNVEVLGRMCRQAGIVLEVVEPLEIEGQLVSSSRVRQLVREGEVALAAKLLTHPYRIRGMVVHGAGRGAELGIPTANVDAIDTLLPAAGVYAGRAYTGNTCWPAAINVGPSPTFGEQATKVEAHLIGYRGMLYHEPLELDFVARLRGTQPFPSAAALREQLELDLQRTVELCRQAGDGPGA